MMNQETLDAVLVAHDRMYEVAVHFGLLPRQLTEKENRLRVAAVQAADTLAGLLTIAHHQETEERTPKFDTGRRHMPNMSKVSGRRVENINCVPGNPNNHVERPIHNDCYRTLPQNNKRYGVEVEGRHAETSSNRPRTQRSN